MGQQHSRWWPQVRTNLAVLIQSAAERSGTKQRILQVTAPGPGMPRDRECPGVSWAAFGSGGDTTRPLWQQRKGLSSSWQVGDAFKEKKILYSLQKYLKIKKEWKLLKPRVPKQSMISSEASQESRKESLWGKETRTSEVLSEELALDSPCDSNRGLQTEAGPSSTWGPCAQYTAAAENVTEHGAYFSALKGWYMRPILHGTYITTLWMVRILPRTSFKQVPYWHL